VKEEKSKNSNKTVVGFTTERSLGLDSGFDIQALRLSIRCEKVSRGFRGMAVPAMTDLDLLPDRLYTGGTPVPRPRAGPTHDFINYGNVFFQMSSLEGRCTFLIGRTRHAFRQHIRV